MDDQHVELLVRMDEKLDAALERLERVETKQDYTNGRVRGLELFRASVLATGGVVVLLAPVWLPHVLG